MENHLSITFKNKNLEVFLSFCAFRKGYEAAAKGFDAQDLDVSVVGRSERSAELCSLLCRSEIMEPPAHVCFQVGLSTWCVGTKREQREAIVKQTGNTVSCFKVEKK